MQVEGTVGLVAIFAFIVASPILSVLAKVVRIANKHSELDSCPDGSILAGVQDEVGSSASK